MTRAASCSINTCGMKTQVLSVLAAIALVAGLAGCVQAETPEEPAVVVTESATATPTPTPTPTPTETSVPTEITSDVAWNLCLDAVKAKDLEDDPNNKNVYGSYKPSLIKELSEGVLRVSIPTDAPGSSDPNVAFCEVSGDPASPDVTYGGTVDVS